LALVLLGLVVFVFAQCDEPAWEERTNYDLLIGEYFEQNPDEFSMFLDILKRSKTLSFLKAYGQYTCFAPNNDAVKSYLTSVGKSSVHDISEHELKQLVRFCVIGDTIPSEAFVDGRLEYRTLYGQFLTTNTFFEDGSPVVKINKVTPIIQQDKRFVNGIVHVVSGVLQPDTRSITDYLLQDGNFSIFSEALLFTGLDEVLDKEPIDIDADSTWYTVFAVPDEVYKSAGISSFEKLKEKYISEPDTSGRDSLYYHMAYHVLPHQVNFVSDLILAKVVKTASPSEVLTVKSVGTTVLINDDMFAGRYEPGFEIDRSISDITVGNGVIHVMKAGFAIKQRFPFAVYWDVCDQLEIKKMPGVYKKTSQNIAYGQLANITWDPPTTSIWYSYPFAPNGVAYAVNDDVFEIYLRPEIVKSVTFKTPTLVKGSYKLWISSRNVPTSARMPKFYVYFNGEQTTRIVDLAKAPGLSGGVAPTDTELNLANFKIAQYKPTDFYATDSAGIQSNIQRGIRLNWLGDQAYGRYACQYAGIVNVEETGSQTLHFTAISGGSGSYLWLDQIHFIPVEEDQNWPRINTEDGSFVYLEDLLAGRFPQPRRN
jgi:uncharacterized surface protein with fasciclin (FAS1) repeats